MNAMEYQAPMLHIAGKWRLGQAETCSQIINPATEEVIGQLSHASQHDLDDALKAAESGFEVWRATTAAQRRRIMLDALELIRLRRETIAVSLTLEQGKPITQARAEVDVACSMIEWYADEAIRVRGRILHVPTSGADGEVRKEPVGPCLLMSPWNMPVVLASRKIAGALAAGCSCIVKPPEETPLAVAKVVECFVEAGVPDGAINVVFGVPDVISSYLIASDTIRKISFTGSVAVGKHIASLAAGSLKKLTLELGGHAPVLIFDDADIDGCADLLVQAKYRNAGQLCHAPTRIFVARKSYGRFVDRFVDRTKSLVVGDGIEDQTQVGPMANRRRVDQVAGLVSRTLTKSSLCTGGERLDRKGFFYAPTVLRDVDPTADAMTEEPFGPVALIAPFDSEAQAFTLANATRYGLASYVFTDSARTQRAAIGQIRAGSVAINNTLATIAEAPFGGFGDSGYGYESGDEGLEGYLNTKFIHRKY